MVKKTSVSYKKWKYAKHAKSLRFCESCFTILTKAETFFCKECLDELIDFNKQEVIKNETI